MSAKSERPRVRVRFRFNVETGETDFIIDDQSPDRSNQYHDAMAAAIAAYLSSNPQIEDAGAIRHELERDRYQMIEAEKNEKKELLTDS